MSCLFWNLARNEHSCVSNKRADATRPKLAAVHDLERGRIPGRQRRRRTVDGWRLQKSRAHEHNHALRGHVGWKQRLWFLCLLSLVQHTNRIWRAHGSLGLSERQHSRGPGRRVNSSSPPATLLRHRRSKPTSPYPPYFYSSSQHHIRAAGWMEVVAFRLVGVPTSRFRGVYAFRSKISLQFKWQCLMTVDESRREHLGTFDSELAAAHAFDVRARAVGRSSECNFETEVGLTGVNSEAVSELSEHTSGQSCPLLTSSVPWAHVICECRLLILASLCL